MLVSGGKFDPRKIHHPCMRSHSLRMGALEGTRFWPISSHQA